MRAYGHGPDRSYIYQPGYLGDKARADLLTWISTLQPLWEQRYSTLRALPPNQPQRALLRPVYWLGNWQFACLGYYEPPRGIRDRAVAAEPFPPVLRALVADIEARTRRNLPPGDVPPGWQLNTCLVNFYGDRLENGKWVDVARVGDHRDFEPGPVASLSLGERARFQFVRPGAASAPPVITEWLEDGSLQIFGGPRWKDQLLHRVQRVEDKTALSLPPTIEGFRTRRINLTLRYVPGAHVVPFARLGADAKADIRGYVETLAKRSPFWQRALEPS